MGTYAYLGLLGLTFIACSFQSSDEDHGEEEGLVASYVRAARELWGSSSYTRRPTYSNTYRRPAYNGSYQRPPANGAGQFSCKMCVGRTIKQYQQFVMRDPSAGRVVNVSCRTYGYSIIIQILDSSLLES